jgi:hypothetical protein
MRLHIAGGKFLYAFSQCVERLGRAAGQRYDQPPGNKQAQHHQSNKQGCNLGQLRIDCGHGNGQNDNSDDDEDSGNNGEDPSGDVQDSGNENQD